MDPKVIVLVAVVILALVAIALVVIMQRRKAALRKRFGPEYERVARERGSEREAQAVLQEREKRIEKYHIRALNAAERQQYAERWRVVQSRFVDDPRGAVIDADDTVVDLMGARGYPMADFEQRTADLSVDHLMWLITIGKPMKLLSGIVKDRRVRRTCARRRFITGRSFRTF